MTSRGDVYLVNFPSGREGEQQGTRPALVIQNDDGNQFSPTTIVATMTSRLTDYRFHVRVKAKDSGLDRDSTVMLEQVRTISQSRLGRRVGRLPSDVMYEVDRALHYSLGFEECPITRSAGP
jgi:mRNA interferase MazF